LAKNISHSISFRSGKVLSIAAYNEYFCILANTTYIDPGNIMTNFKNLRASYLTIFSTHNSTILEV